MQRVFRFSIPLVAFAATSLAAPASATSLLTVPDAAYSAGLGRYANFTSNSYFGIGTYNDGFSTVTVGAQPSPFIRANAVGVPANGNPAVNGAITYYVGVEGPDDGSFVPISVAYKMSGKIALVGGAYDAFAQSEMTLISEYRGNRISTVHEIGSGNFDVSGTAAWLVASGTTGQVMLASRAGFVVGYVDASGTADAFIDPVFTIDAAYAASHPGLSLVFSQGVGNSSAPSVPEPATWALMLGGFGVSGTILRRRGARPARLAA